VSFPLFVARRYFLGKRRQNFINVIALLSMGGVAFATAALIIVLSVFNGIGGLLRSLYTSFDPPISISATKGKSFLYSDSLRQLITSTPGVAGVTEVIQDYVYVRNRINETEADMVVTLRAVSDDFLMRNRLENFIIAGKFSLWQDSLPAAVIGAGVRNTLSVNLEKPVSPIQVYYVKGSTTSVTDPSALYSSRQLMPAGVFAIEKNFDENFIFAPLHFAEELFGYGQRRTSLEILPDGNSDTDAVRTALKQRLGDAFQVLTDEEQHRDLYRLLRLEKGFTFLSLSLLILVASINIFFSLMMLVLDKRKDVAILRALGADSGIIRKIFVAEAFIVSGYGSLAGLLIGLMVCLLQLQFGLVGMGMENAVVSSYPVEIKLTDFILVLTFNLLVTLAICWLPARLAARQKAVGAYVGM